jgi:hypothetical protein
MYFRFFLKIGSDVIFVKLTYIKIISNIHCFHIL